MAVAKNAFGAFFENLICPAIALAAVMLIVQPAKAIVVSIGSTSATLECTNGISVPCAGFTGAGGNTGSPPTGAGTLDTTAPYTAFIYSLNNYSPATEASALNTLAGTDYTTGTQLNTGGLESYSFSTDAEYFMIKLGLGGVFFENLTGAPIYLEFLANGASGGGLSHVTAFGGTVSPVPLPAAFPLFLFAVAGFGLIGWRRRNL